MAYLVDRELSFSTTGSASFALTMPQHQTDDILVAIVGEDGAGSLAMTGWTATGTLLTSSGSAHSSRIFFKKATSSSETGTVTMGTVDAISVIVLSLRDVNVSTIATTATSGTGSVCTITFADQGSTPYLAGTIITVAGVTPTAYNGDWVSTGGTATTVTFSHTATGAQTVAGTVTAHVDNTAQSAVAAASQFSSLALTTNTNDTFVLYAMSQDGIAPMIHTDPGPAMFIISSDSTGTTSTTAASTAAAWYIQRTAGAAPTPSWTANKSALVNKYTISFRNKSGGSIPAYIDDVTSPGTYLDGCHYGVAGTTFNGVTPTAALPYANIGPAGSGLTTTYDAIGLTADYGINFYSSAISSTPSTSAVGTSKGFVLTFSAARNLTGGFVMGSVIAANPKIANFFHGSTPQGGSWISFGDASNFYRSYQIFSRDSKPNTEGRAVFSVRVDNTTTRYGYSTSALVDTAVTSIMFLSNCPAGALTLYLSELHLVKTHVIAGGSAVLPVDTVGVAAVGKSFRLPVIQQVGSSGLLTYVPIQIGGGDAVNFQIDAGALQFPRRWNTDTNELNFHAEDNDIGINYAGKSGDVVKHTNSVITSPSQYYWKIDTAATSAAEWNFSGLTIVGATVTLRPVTTFSSMTFSSCQSIAAEGCTLNDCTINKVAVENDTFTSDTSTNVDNSSIDVSLVTAGNRWCSVVNPTIFEGNVFTGGGGHAIRITAIGTYNFIGNVFTGFGADTTTGAAILNDSGGLVTLNISGSGTTPSYKNGTSASTVINNNVLITLTGLKNPTEVRVFDAGTTTERAGTGAENVTTGSHEFSVPVSTSIDINILSLGYQNMRILAYSTAVDASIPVSQVLDRQYNNPA